MQNEVVRETRFTMASGEKDGEEGHGGGKKR